MLRRLPKLAMSLMAAVTVVFGASELLSAQSLRTAADCGEGNWCALSKGGQTNCTDCCRDREFDDGFCASMQEDAGPPPLAQYCICI